MDTGDVEKFFCFKPVENTAQTVLVDVSFCSLYLTVINRVFVETFFLSFLSHSLTKQDMNDMDLDMLAPYISMDDDFQLSQLNDSNINMDEVATTTTALR